MLEKLLLRKATYRTRSVEVSVEFSDGEQIIDTFKDPVVCHRGDAIVTGVKGERHPQSVGKFDGKYEPIQGQKSHLNCRFTKALKQFRLHSCQHCNLTVRLVVVKLN